MIEKKYYPNSEDASECVKCGYKPVCAGVNEKGETVCDDCEYVKKSIRSTWERIRIFEKIKLIGVERKAQGKKKEDFLKEVEEGEFEGLKFGGLYLEDLGKLWDEVEK